MVKNSKNNPDSRFKVRLRETTRRILRLFNYFSERDIEYNFAYRNVIGRKLSILDIGGCDSLLSLYLAKQGHKVTVYDFRFYPERHSNLTVIQGDFLINKLPAKSFDIIILVSTIEHTGFSSYGAPVQPDSDFKVMEKLKRLLNDSGKVVLTFPFNESEKIIPGFERWYDPVRIRKLFKNWFILNAEYWVPTVKILNHWLKWIPATKEDAASSYRLKGVQGVAGFVITLHPIKII